MSRRQRSGRRWFAGAWAVLALAAPAGLVAQGGDGYLFKRPVVTFEFESGYGFQRANSDIYDFVIGEHTLGRRDFDSPYLGAELSVRVSERADLSIAVGHLSSSRDSEFREWVDQDGLPITQVTRLAQTPATIGFKVYPFPRGRMLGRFAWVPRTVSPYAGASVGFVSYRFEQRGDFIDFSSSEVFTDTFRSVNRGLLVRLAAGMNVSLGQQFLASGEARYGWADGRMSGDFIDFDPIDLSGFQLVAGLGVRF